MSESENKSKDLTVLKGQMVNVIANLQNKHELSEVMPLLNLLKTLESHINTANTTDFINWNAVNMDEMKLKLGTETIGITQKICFLFNRIHIEGAYLASLNKSVAYGIKTHYKSKEINQFIKQKTYSTEKKKLFILSLKLILRENLAINTTGLTLDAITDLLLADIGNGIMNLFNIIHDGCTICNNNHEICQSESGPFCFCKLKTLNSKETRRYSGVVKFKFGSFMGMYEANYMDEILLNNAPRLVVDQFKHDNNNKVKRRCGVVVKEKTVYSDWTNGLLSISGDIEVINAKEMEIQVWEASSKQGGNNHIVAVAIVPLQSLLESKNPNSISISMEPEGYMVGEIKFAPSKKILVDYGDLNKENRPLSSDIFQKIGVKRRVNILTKLTGHRLARHVEANVPVSVWLDWFQNHIDRLAIPVENNKKNSDDKEKKALGFNNKKIMITPCKTPVFKKMANESYRQVSKSPIPERIIATSKLNQTNPRAVCRFNHPQEIRFADQEAVPDEPIVSADFVMSTPYQNKSLKTDNKTHYFEVEQSCDVLMSPIPPVNYKTPKRPTKYYNVKPTPKNNKTLDICSKSMFLADASLTRSNIELTNVNEQVSFRSHKSQSFICSKYQCDDSGHQTDFRQANMFSKNILQSPFFLDPNVDFIPNSCSMALRNNSVSRIASENNHSERSKQSNTTDKCVDRDWGSSYYDKSSYLSESSLYMDSYKQGIEVNDPRSDRSYCSDAKGEGDDYDDVNDCRNGDYDCVDEGEIDIEHRTNGIRQEFEKQTKVTRTLKLRDLKLLTVLGQGHFGKVLLAEVKRTKALCAIKSIQKARASTETEYDSLFAERRILMLIRNYNHPFLVNLISCFQSERYLFFAMEYVSGGDFMGHVHKNPFSEDDARFHIACIVMAFEFLHSKDIIYRDLKLDNVLMDRQGYAKLTDFGLSKENMKWNSTTTTFCGTPEFLAPEIIEQQDYTRVIDWWALGVLIFEMIAGESPFPGEDDAEIFSNILHTTPNCKDLSSEAISLIKRLLKRNPEKRLGYGENGAEKVKAHSFFKAIDWTKLYMKQIPAPFVPVLEHLTDTQYFESEFTSQRVTIEHEDENDELEIDDDLFSHFDSDQKWDYIKT